MIIGVPEGWQADAWAEYDAIGLLILPEVLPEPRWWQVRARLARRRSDRRFLRAIEDALTRPIDG